MTIALNTGAVSRSTSEDQQPALELVGLRKQVNGITVVDDVDLTVARGSALGILCPADTERSMLLRLVLGRTEPDRGRVLIFGRKPGDQPDIAVVAGAKAATTTAVPLHWTARDWIGTLSWFHGVDPMVVAVRVEQMLGSWYLAEAESITVAEFAPGMRTKVAVAVAVATGPRLLLVDEPFAGIDEESAADVEVILSDFVQSGGTIVVSDRVLSPLERVCDDILAVDRGHTMARTARKLAPVAALRARLGSDRSEPSLSAFAFGGAPHG